MPILRNSNIVQRALLPRSADVASVHSLLSVVRPLSRAAHRLLWLLTLGLLWGCNQRSADLIDSLANRHGPDSDAGQPLLPSTSDQPSSLSGDATSGQNSPNSSFDAAFPGNAVSSSSPDDAGPALESAESRDTEDLPLQAEFADDQCPQLTINIDMTGNDEYSSDRGVLVKVLQYPEFTEANRAPPGDLPPVPPPEWDRSEFPENACVVRLRGVQAECYTNQYSMAIYRPEPDAGSPVGQASYFARRFLENVDLCDWTPGCPRPDWGNFTGYWWYLTQRENDALLISCPASCEGFFRQPIDVELNPLNGPSLCDQPRDAGAPN